jgi:hypothetical protein
MPLSLEHQSAYEDFLTKLLAKAEKFEATRQALGAYVLEMLRNQAAELKSVKPGASTAFDTGEAARVLAVSLNSNANWMAKKGDEFRSRLEFEIECLNEIFEKKHRHAWLTANGQFRLQRALDLLPVAGREAAVFPLRTRAVRGTLIAVMGALAVETNVASWTIALQTMLQAYENYRYDFCTLTKLEGPRFLEHARLVDEMVKDIDERIEAKEVAAEAAVREAAARFEAEAEADGEDETTGAAYPHGAHSSDILVESSPHHWDDWEPDYNPANGLPMMGGFDVHGNAYGKNWND